MNDPPQLLRPTRHASGHSPTRYRAADDIIPHTGPSTAVDALSDTGPLRKCLDGASVTEQDFALRTALASRRIWEWVDELEEWHWPHEGGCAGFELPGWKRRKPSIEVIVPDKEDGEYIGSLPAEDVAKYERRIEEIHHEMSGLAVEDIKSHIMTNHIIPLSRPGTPMSDTRSAVSTFHSYNRMEDLTAVITAMVVQTLPNLAKLSRLLQIWSIRLAVLSQILPLLNAIEDAEIALKSGWNAITTQNTEAATSSDSSDHMPTLKRNEFEVMKKVLERRVAKPGRTLDYMLDSLEGQQDTLPELWLDRMEAVERDYGEWVAACEKRIREAAWAYTSGTAQSKQAAASHDAPIFSEELKSDAAKARLTDAAVRLPPPYPPDGLDGLDEPSKEQRDLSSSLVAVAEPGAARVVVRPVEDGQRHEAVQNGFGLDGTEEGDQYSAQGEQSSIMAEAAGARYTEIETRPRWISEDDICSPHNDIEGFSDPEAEPELPPLRNEPEHDSDISDVSTVVYGASSRFGLSSDLPEIHASPEISRSRIREAEYINASPPSSPPLPPDAEQSGVTHTESPRIRPLPDDDDNNSFFPTTEIDDSFQDDHGDAFSTSEVGHHVNRHESIGDQQLRQQISEIIESIPAKIKLTNEPPTIDLNPPDLQLPRLRKKPSRDLFRRSASSMSSRTATPSFTLSPAKNTKLRQQRGQQEIKVYHLSRSNGEASIKLFIRCVGENGERVMVRVGGGWADLSEYLKEYASHHGHRSSKNDKAKVEVQDLPRASSGRVPSVNIGSSPPSRPASALEAPSSPLAVRKIRAPGEVSRLRPKTPTTATRHSDNIPSSEDSTRSRSSSRLSWVEDDSSFLGLAGPSAKRVEMSEENKAWVESIKEKVRLASGEHRVSAQGNEDKNRFGEMDRAGGTKRLFRKSDNIRDLKK